MFDIGWLELIVIGIVALIVVGPKDLPGMFRTVGRFMGKARGMAREFQRAMEDESGLKEAASSLNTIKDPLAQAQASAKSYTDSFLKERDEKEARAEDAAEAAEDLADADTVLDDPGQVQEPEPAPKARAKAAKPAVEKKAAPKKTAAKKAPAKKPAARKAAPKAAATADEAKAE